MTLAQPFCGVMDPAEHQSHWRTCLRETLFDVFIPCSFVLLLSIISFIRSHAPMSNRSSMIDDLRLPTIKQSRILPRSVLMLILILLDISCWAFLFAWRLESFILERHRDGTALYTIVDPAFAFSARIYALVLVIRSISSPIAPGGVCRFTGYRIRFLVFYSILVLAASIKLLSPTGAGSSPSIETPFAIIDLALCLSLWLLSLCIPKELDPRELLEIDDSDGGILVLFDGRVVRNGRILSLEANASFLSMMTFSWINSLLYQVRKTPFSADHLWAMPIYLRAQESYLRFLYTSGSLVRRLYQANRKAATIQCVTALIAVLFHYANPYFLYQILNYIHDPQNQPNRQGYIYCLALFICSITNTFIASQTLLWGKRWQVGVTHALSAAIYDCALHRRTPMDELLLDENEPNISGDLFTPFTKLMSHDTERLAELASCLHVFYTCPLEILIGCGFLYHLLGQSFLVGLIAMVIALPATQYVKQQLVKAQQRLAEMRTWRVRLLRDVFLSMKTIKILAWEQKWIKVITSSRDDELVKLIKLCTQNTLHSLIWFIVPALVTVISFACTAFVSLVLFGMIRDPLNILPQMYSTFSDARDSLHSIDSYMNQSKEKNKNRHNQNEMNNIHTRTGFQAGTFRWITDTVIFALVVPDMVFPENAWSIIAGPEKSGKTSLLLALLGQMPRDTGVGYLPLQSFITDTGIKADPQYPTLCSNRVAYVAQDPWISNGTVRENILFNESWDDTRYRQALAQCDLMYDLSLLEQGDLTPIGDRGLAIPLSVKQRISLARACYTRAKTVLIDDIFKDLEPFHVEHIMAYCVGGNLMNGRTVLVCTRHLESWTKHAKMIIGLNGGIATVVDRADAGPSASMDGDVSNIHDEEGATYPEDNTMDGQGDSIDRLFDVKSSLDDDLVDGTSVIPESTRLTDDGHPMENKRRDMAYATYFSACGGTLFWGTTIMCVVLARLAAIAEIYWLKIWTVDNGEAHLAGESSIHRYVTIYAGLGLLSVLFNFSRTIIQYRGSLRASNRLFHGLLHAVFQAPMAFFDNTPLEPTMDRFSKDMETIDTQLGWQLHFLLQMFVGIIILSLTIGAILPEFFIVMLIAAAISVHYGLIYMVVSRVLKRRHAMSRPLVFYFFADTLSGMTTIKAYGQERWMVRTLFQLLDDSARAFYLQWATNRWLFVRVELVGACASLTVSLLLVQKISTIDTGLAGMALTLVAYLFNLTYWFMRQSTTVDLHMEAVERVNEYMDMAQEPPGTVQGSRPPPAWPTAGAIQVRDLMVFGEDTRPILNHISFNIRAAETVALVGRSGGEIQALLSCLVRFTDPARGSVKIDGVNVAWIGVQDLRSQITYISRHGTMLGTTIRSNLDPFGEYDDYELWQALGRVHLVDDEQRTEGVVVRDLDMEIGEEGMRLDPEERQLLCLARALLRDCTKVVILEMAETVEPCWRLTRVIQDELKESTALVVPYRLRTITNDTYDRVMVFDQGDLVEFDKPSQLLQLSQGMLHALFERSKPDCL